MEFATQRKKNKKQVDFNDGTRRIDSAGYVPAKIRIEEMLNAGRRLVASRREMHDFDGENDDDGEFVDPTRAPGFDLADATRIRNNLARKVAVSALAEKKEEKKSGRNSDEKVDEKETEKI